MARRIGIPTLLEVKLRQADITQLQLAERLNTHQPTISNLLSADPESLTPAQVKLLKRIAKELKFTDAPEKLLDEITAG